jgi:HEAT repeat protein
MTILQRRAALFAATITIALNPLFLHAEDTPQAAKTKALIAVLQSNAATFDKARACQQLAALGDKAAVPALAALLADEKLSAHARSALEATADASAADALRESLGRLHGNLLAGVVNSLGVRRDVQAVGALEKLAAVRTSGVQDEALAALGCIATPEAIQSLRQVLTDVSAESRLGAAHACLSGAERLLAQGKRAEAIALLDAVRGAKVPTPLQAAATYGAIVARQSSDLSLLGAQLKADDRVLFAAALRATRRLPGPEVTRALWAELEHLPPARRALVIGALSERGDALDLSVVQKAAATGPKEVRLAALGALGTLGDASTVPLLVDMALAADAELAQAARQSLLLSRASGIDAALAARLSQGTPKDRIVLLDILGQRADASTAAAVAKLAGDANNEVRLAAIAALGRIINPGDVQVLMGCLRGAKTPAETAIVQQALRTAYNRVPDQDACVGKLHAGMSAAPLADQCFLLELIGQVGGREALKIIAAHARDSRAEIRDVATRVLGAWMDADAAPVLLDLAKSLGDARLRTRALRGYLRIARQLNLPTDQRLAMCEAALQVAQRDEEKRLAAEIARIVLRKAPSAAQAARAKAILAKVPGKKAPLFDGHTFNGWEGDTKQTFRIESGAIVGGSLKAPVPHNEFLCTKASYTNFILRAECKLLGPANGGIQIRSQRVPNNYEVSGYQADMSAEADGGYWGCLYDESRRNQTLVVADHALIKKILKPADWNQYEIRCEGPHIRLFLNGVQTADFTETDGKFPQTGIIGLQIHSGGPSEAWYRNITIEELP